MKIHVSAKIHSINLTGVSHQDADQTVPLWLRRALAWSQLQPI